MASLKYANSNPRLPHAAQNPFAVSLPPSSNFEFRISNFEPPLPDYQITKSSVRPLMLQILNSAEFFADDSGQSSQPARQGGRSHWIGTRQFHAPRLLLKLPHYHITDHQIGPFDHASKFEQH